jgi:CheY-like chemotaxis protein
MIPRQRYSILCVDDNPAILEMLQRILESGGYTSQTAINGFAALAKVNKDPHAIELIITDLRMPGLDGVRLIEQARAAGYGGTFIVLAGSIAADDRLRLGELGVRMILEKPSRAADILGAVRQAQAGF